MLRDQIRPYIDQIVKRELTNRAVAALIGASEYQVCRMLKQMGVVRDPAPDRKARSKLLAERRAYRLHVAQTLPIKEAAAAAKCSTRTIYRLRDKT